MLEIHVQLHESGADLGRIDEVTRNLLRDLNDRELIVERQGAQPPTGAKAGAAFTVGALVVALTNSRAVANFTSGILEWLARSKQRSVKIAGDGITMELSSVSPEEQRQLVALLTDRLAVRPDRRDGRPS